MKKILTIILLILLISSCSSNKDNNNQEGNNSVPEEQQTVETKDINVWDVLPIYEYDAIDNWLTTRNSMYSEFKAEGATSDYTRPSDFYSVSYNRNDFYNSDGSDLFIIGSFEKGGLMIKKDGYWGLINSKGEIKTECSNTYKTQLFGGVVYSGGRISHDYTLYGGEGFGGGGGTGTSLLFFDINGNVYTGEEENKYANSYTWTLNKFSKVDLFEDAVKSGYVGEDGFILLNSYAGIIDHEKYFPEIKLPTNCIEAYIVIDKDRYKILDIPSNYVVNDFSDDIISFAECSIDPRASKPIKDDEGYVWGNALARNYYVYELYCDDYSYYNFTFVDKDGNIIARGFDDAYGFYDGYAAVKKNGKWGFIDKQGKVIVDFIFDKATALSEGKSWVIYNGKTGRLNLVELLENGITISYDVLNSERITVE